MKALFLIPLLLIFYAVAVVSVRKKSKRWLMPWEWPAGIMRAMFGDYRTEHVLEKYQAADDAYWYPPKEMGVEVARQVLEELPKEGYGPKDYEPNRHDCDDYELAGRKKAHDIFLEKTKDLPEARGKAFPIHPVSFRRDDNGRRHRLFFIEDDAGTRWYVENWPVHDSHHMGEYGGIFRKMHKKELENSYIPA